MLKLGESDLHSSGASDRGVRNIAIARDLVRCVDDNHALHELFGEHASDLAKLGRFSTAWFSEHQDGFT
jgi:hypothetical protein